MNNDSEKLSHGNASSPNTDERHQTKIADHASEHKLPAPSNLNESLSEAAISIGNGYLELLEERPVINKERLDVGKVTVNKHTRKRTIEVPIELVEEYITINTAYHDSESQDLLSGKFEEKDILRHVEPSLDSKAVVTINGKQIEIGDAPVEIVLSRQVATITKDTYVIQEIDISKTTHTHTDTLTVELKHEELEVSEEGFLKHDRK